MIKITIELWPHGDETRKLPLAAADIWNDGSGSPTTGSYGFKLFGKSRQLIREGRIGIFRRQDFSVWWLIAAVVKKAFPDVEDAFIDKRIVGIAHYEQDS